MSFSPKGPRTMHNMSSLPEIPHGTMQGEASIIKEMQREKERLHRYFQSKERTQKLLEDMEKHGKDLLKKKEAKLAKIREKKKLEFKIIKEKAEIYDQKILDKRRHLSQMEREHVEHGEELFLKHLEEIKTMNEEKIKKQKEQCEITYKRNIEQLQKHAGKQEAK